MRKDRKQRLSYLLTVIEIFRCRQTGRGTLGDKHRDGFLVNSESCADTCSHSRCMVWLTGPAQTTKSAWRAVRQGQAEGCKLHNDWSPSTCPSFSSINHRFMVYYIFVQTMNREYNWIAIVEILNTCRCATTFESSATRFQYLYPLFVIDWLLDGANRLLNRRCELILSVYLLFVNDCFILQTTFESQV